MAIPSHERAVTAGFSLRPARARDAWAVRRLVWRARIYPFGLDWRRFWLAVDCRDRLLGCGQVKRLPDGSRELASIATQPGSRGQGIASAVVRRLISQAGSPLYLMCASPLAAFYRRFGFVEIPYPEMPPHLARRWRMVEAWRRVFKALPPVRVMRRDQQNAD